MKKSYPQQEQPQKIPFWRKRWFWGVVVGAVMALVAVSSPALFLYESIGAWFRIAYFFFYLAMSFIVSVPLPLIILFKLVDRPFIIYDIITNYGYWGITIYLLLYYSSILFLFYKAFRNKKVKIRYSIILTTVLIISFIGNIIIALAAKLFFILVFYSKP
jgi:hypothetical protein